MLDEIAFAACHAAPYIYHRYIYNEYKSSGFTKWARQTQKTCKIKPFGGYLQSSDEDLLEDVFLNGRLLRDQPLRDIRAVNS